MLVGHRRSVKRRKNVKTRNRRSISKIYYFKIYDNNNNLICDLVPCYRKSDGVIGMYDLVSDVFRTNLGTGTFTKGPDVN